MTIGIGGWGSRRKPMALVRAILRTPVRDLTVVSFGGPDVGLLCAAGKVRELVFGFVSLDSIAYDPHFVRARQAGAIAVRELDEGMVVAGLRAAAQRLPFLPIRAGLGSDVLTYYPGLRTVRSPYDDGEELVAMPALPLDVALVHLNRADAHGNAALPRPGPVLRRPVLPGRDAPGGVVRADRADRRARRRRAPAGPAAQPDDGRRGRRGARRRRLHLLRARLRPRRGRPARVRRRRRQA